MVEVEEIDSNQDNTQDQNKSEDLKVHKSKKVSKSGT